jgi:hypothetical protein
MSEKDPGLAFFEAVFALKFASRLVLQDRDDDEAFEDLAKALKTFDDAAETLSPGHCACPREALPSDGSGPHRIGGK